MDPCFKDQSLLQLYLLFKNQNPFFYPTQCAYFFSYDSLKRKGLISPDTMKCFAFRIGFGQFSLKVVTAFLNII